MDKGIENGINSFNRLLIHPNFLRTVEELDKLKIKLPQNPASGELDFSSYTYPDNGVLEPIGKTEPVSLLPLKGQELANKVKISGYDESYEKFVGLEGIAYLYSHSLILHGEDDYVSSNFLAFYFYTRSRQFTNKSNFIKYSEDPDSEAKLDYVNDRTRFLVEGVPKNCVVFIDGPLIGGQCTAYTVSMNRELLNKEVVPIFFVKNSPGNLVTNNIKELNGKFNSDMHWAYKTLNPGERTNFFKYVDRYNVKNAKIFCYLKTFDVSPQRVEFHVSTFEKYGEKSINELMDLVYYLTLVQGDLKNPQLRSIAIAEKYARSTKGLINLYGLMKQLGIMGTMNQERGMVQV